MTKPNWILVAACAGVLLGGWGIHFSLEELSFQSQQRDIIEHWNAWRVVMRDPKFLEQSKTYLGDMNNSTNEVLAKRGIHSNSPGEFVRNMPQIQSAMMNPTTMKTQKQMLNLM